MKNIVVVATGQNVANLGPLLHAYSPGDVVWLAYSPSSAMAPYEHLAQVLHGLGITYRLFDEPLPADTANLAVWAGTALAEIRCQSPDPVALIGNGGTKPMHRALVNAWGRELSVVIYGEGEPVRVVEMSPDGGFQPLPFSGSRLLDLDTVLGCSGHVRRGGLLLWSARPQDVVSGLHPGGPWFVDSEAFAQAYEQERARFLALQERAREEFATPPHLPKVLSLADATLAAEQGGLDKLLQQWTTALKATDHDPAAAVIGAMCAVPRPARDDVLAVRDAVQAISQRVIAAERDFSASRATLSNGGAAFRAQGMAWLLEPLLQQVAKTRLRDEERSRLFRAAVDLHQFAQRAALALPASKGNDLAFDFERAVVRRLCQHLALRPAWHALISQVWTGVKVLAQQKRSRPGKLRAEWDVVLVLRNGVLVNIECKSWQGVTKDLDARTQVMHEGGSSLATMWLCSPLATEFADRPWFRVLHDFRQDRLEGGYVHVAFTLPGQRNTYRHDGDDYDCPTFEEQLDAAFERYVPA